MWTRPSLVRALDEGDSIDFFFFFFWGHTPKGKAVDASCLSQWFPRAFVAAGVTYATAEHWRMAAKARLFGDEAILACAAPAEAKAFRRRVRGFGVPARPDLGHRDGGVEPGGAGPAAVARTEPPRLRARRGAESTTR